MADTAEFRDFRLVKEHQSWTPAGPVLSRLPDPEIETLEGQASATVAEPATLALFGFATGTWMAGAAFGGFVAPATQLALAPVLILFAGIAQFIAGLFTFRRVNTLNASAFCCYGSFNTIVGVILLFEAGGLIPRGPETNTVLGWLNCSFGFISLALMLGALRRNLMMVATLAFLVGGYSLIGITQFNIGPEGVTTVGTVATAGGALLFAAAFCAYYIGMAMIVNSTWKRTLLPLFGDA
ncbi:MAG TPA: GPR1/FUN34/YaaH family transporter [Acetobacteraceae bacterium]|nr:GPR1/FUN34/YaaH family transporter [Acetobacteraceae bacterium]